jgi:hypothetical protein
MRGEPFSVQMVLYFAALFEVRNGTITPLTKSILFQKEISITRSSIKKSFRYFLTSLLLKESGEPRLANKIAFVAIFKA